MTEPARTDAPAPRRVLVVEDEAKVADAIRHGLESEGYEAVVSPTAADARARLNDTPFDVVLLDLGLPDGDGLQVLTHMRKRGLDARVLVLTARDTLDERVRGLDAGADDYVVKQFAFAEDRKSTRL